MNIIRFRNHLNQVDLQVRFFGFLGSTCLGDCCGAPPTMAGAGLKPAETQASRNMPRSIEIVDQSCLWQVDPAPRYRIIRRSIAVAS
jgi:hypothetical protein